MTYLFECPYNRAIICDEEKCRKCGWNPRVEQERKFEIRIKLSEEPPVKREKWLIGRGAFTK